LGANIRIFSVGAFHNTKSNVAQIICRSNINTHLTRIVASCFEHISNR